MLSIFSQTTKLDSLLLLLNSANSDYELAIANFHLAKAHESINMIESKEFSLKSLEYKSSDSLLAETYNQLGRISFFESKLDSAIYYFDRTKHFFSISQNLKRIAEINISIGSVQLKQADYNKAIKTLTKSATFFENTNDSINTAKCYNNIASAFAELDNYLKAIEYTKKALTIFENQNETYYQLIALPNLAIQHFKNGDTSKAIEYSIQAEKLGIKLNNKRSLSIIYNNLGTIYLDNNPQKAKKYLEKTLALKKELNIKNGIEITQGNLGYIHFKNKNYKKAIQYYNLVAEKVNGKQLIFVYDRLKECHKELNRLDMALNLAEKSSILKDSILNIDNQKQFAEIQTKYETEKKEREIAELRSSNIEIDYKRKMNRYLLFMVSGLLIIMLLLVYFVFKSLKRKRLLVQQSHTIKTKKLEKLLKHQELEGIDAILDAQEKERDQIANDLHDNLGSKIATLKLYIDEITNIENDNQDEKRELTEKLKELSNETYKEVRTIAHQKNFGTFINKGLLPSIRAIANQISSSHKLAIELINININTHITNTVEIQIFRIIQELLTNCIKHSEASTVIIQFSEYDSVLNVIVEDNGKGFDKNKVSSAYGLKNVKRRIEKIGGTIEIDPRIGEGTTVILNIPL